MRIACVLVTHLRAKVEMRRQPQLKDSPVLIVDRNPSRERPLVLDRFPAASGVTAGMTLEQAVSRHVNAIVLDTDELHYRRIFDKVLAALQGVSDRVEDSELGTAYVRLDGLEGLYRGEAGVASSLLNAVPAYMAPRIGVADVKFPAFVSARICGAHRAFRVPRDVVAFLAPHPIDLLPVSSSMKVEMHRLGLHTMGAVAAMSEHTLMDRFGPEGWRAWSLCNGIDNNPVVPMAFEDTVVERASLPFHSSSVEALLVVVDTLLRRAYSRPEMRGRYACAADLLCAASDWPLWERRIRFKQPTGAWESASFSIRSRLEADPPHNPIEDVALTLSGLTGESGVQIGLLKDIRDVRQSRLVEVERRMRDRMNGNHTLHRIAEVAPWHPAPEMRALQVPIDPSGIDAIRPLNVPKLVEVREGAGGDPASVQVDRRWRQVDRIDDRWTFDLWWLPEPVTRDYYRIDSSDGRRITLFHDPRHDRWYRQSA